MKEAVHDASCSGEDVEKMAMLVVVDVVVVVMAVMVEVVR